MDNKIIIFLLLLFGFNLSAQVTPNINFAVRFNISQALGSDPYTITGTVLDDLSKFTGSDVSIGDSLYVIDGSNLIVLKVTSITSVLGSTVHLVADDPHNAGISLPTGQAALIRPSTTHHYPYYVSGLRNDLQAMIQNRLVQLIDQVSGSGGGDITNFVGISGVSPLVAASAHTGETWRNSVGELWASNGTIWSPAVYSTGSSNSTFKYLNGTPANSSTISTYRIGNTSFGGIVKDTLFAVTSLKSRDGVYGTLLSHPKVTGSATGAESGFMLMKLDSLGFKSINNSRYGRFQNFSMIGTWGNMANLPIDTTGNALFNIGYGMYDANPKRPALYISFEQAYHAGGTRPQANAEWQLEYRDTLGRISRPFTFALDYDGTVMQGGSAVDEWDFFKSPKYNTGSPYWEQHNFLTGVIDYQHQNSTSIYKNGTLSVINKKGNKNPSRQNNLLLLDSRDVTLVGDSAGIQVTNNIRFTTNNGLARITSTSGAALFDSIEFTVKSTTDRGVNLTKVGASQETSIGFNGNGFVLGTLLKPVQIYMDKSAPNYTLYANSAGKVGINNNGPGVGTLDVIQKSNDFLGGIGLRSTGNNYGVFFRDNSDNMFLSTNSTTEFKWGTGGVFTAYTRILGGVSTNSANQTSIGVVNNTGISQIYRYVATPENTITGNRGDITLVDDGANGFLYSKYTGISTTGWGKLFNLADPNGATTNQVMQYNGTSWVPATISGGGGGSLPNKEIGYGNGSSIVSEPLFNYDPAINQLNVDTVKTVKTVGTIFDKGINGGQVYNVIAYGLIGDGIADNTTAYRRLLNLVTVNGGGTIFFPVGTFLISGKIKYPVVYPGGVPAPRQVPLIIKGAGSWGTGNNYQPYGGTIIQLGYSNSSDTLGRWVFMGSGNVEITGITFQTPGSAINYTSFMQFTMTTSHIHHCTFWGSTFNDSDETLNREDVIQYGGTNNVEVPLDTAQTQAFQGYGSVLENCTFSKVQAIVVFGGLANAITVKNNWLAHGCGGIAAFSDIPSVQINGNIIDGNTIETGSYKRPVWFRSATQTFFSGNTFYDHTSFTECDFRFDGGSIYNSIFGGFTDIIPIGHPQFLGTNKDKINYFPTGQNDTTKLQTHLKLDFDSKMIMSDWSPYVLNGTDYSSYKTNGLSHIMEFHLNESGTDKTLLSFQDAGSNAVIITSPLSAVTGGNTYLDAYNLRIRPTNELWLDQNYQASNTMNYTGTLAIKLKQSGQIFWSDGTSPGNASSAGLTSTVANILRTVDGSVVDTRHQAKEFYATGTTADVLPVGTTAQEPTGVQGMIRANSTTGKIMVVESGTSFSNIITANSVKTLMREEYFTATAAQTAFTIALSLPAVSGTSIPIRVYRNGVKLTWVTSSPSATQFTYSGTTVTTTANTSGDIIAIEYLN